MFGKNETFKQSDFANNNKLIIKDIWFTIQGEGLFTGYPATFVRLGRCNLSCNFCDTNFDDDLYNLTVDDAIVKIRDITPHHTKFVIITGGEPFLQPLLAELVNKLLDMKFVVQIETAGTLWIDKLHVNHPDFYIVCSPKTGKLNPKLEQWISAYKYIISKDNYDMDDGLPNCINGIKTKLARPLSRTTPIYISPMDEYDIEKNKANITSVRNIALKFGYRVSLQTHKILGVE
jgi:organic radical activating enzyme